MIKHTLIFFFLMAALSASSQKTISLPLMEGTPDDDSAPTGWQVHEPSPDIIEGNGPWPMGTYTVADVNGGNIAGKTMGLFLSSDSTMLEGWSTSLQDLQAGETYSFSFLWQQATLLSGTNVWYRGGELLVIVDGDSTIFKSNDVAENDTWQTASINFVATNASAEVIVKIQVQKGVYTGTYGGAIVLDNICRECNEAGMY